jgi:uncharacterized tellurite resistance protein B-like protein
MDFNEKIGAYSRFYYLLAEMDGGAVKNEILLCHLMCESEAFDTESFNALVISYKSFSEAEVFKNCLQSLKKCDYPTQAKCLAWMVNIAYADSVMTDNEWRLIFNIKKELNVKHSDVLEVQRHLPSIFSMHKKQNLHL